MVWLLLVGWLVVVVAAATRRERFVHDGAH